MVETPEPVVLRKTGWLLLVATLILHAYLAWHLKDYIRNGYTDFTIFYSAGKILREGPRPSLYDRDLQYQVQKQFAPNVTIRQAALPYNHPPFEALLFVPLTWFSYFNAYLVWNLFNVVILCMIPILLRDHVAILRTRPPWFWVLLTLAFFPTFMTLIQGQDSILLLLIFVLTFVFLKKNMDFLAGCCLALGLFRFHLVLPFALVLLLRGRRNAIFGFGSVAAGWLVISAGLVGWGTVLHYPQYLMRLETAGAGGAIVPANMPTIHGLLAAATPLIGKIVSEAVVGILSCALVLIGVLCWPDKDKDKGRTNFDLSFSLVALIAVLVSYHAYAHDLSILLLALLLAAQHLRAIPMADQRNRNMLAPMFLLYLSPLYMLLWFYWQHLNLLGLVLLWWTWALWREIRQQSKATSAELPGAS